MGIILSWRRKPAMAEKKEVTRVRLQKGLYIVKRGHRWYAERCAHGMQTRWTLGTSDPDEAATKAFLQATGKRPQSIFPRPAPKPDVLLLGKALEEYEEWYRRNRRDSGSKRLFPVLHVFVDALGDGKETRTITRDDIQHWIDSRVDGRSPTTVRGDFARVRAFIYWLARRKDAADANSCRGIDKPRDDGLTREAPSSEKVRGVLGKLRSHLWLGDFAHVLAETGMRPTELLGVRGIDLRGKLLSIVPWESRQLKSKWSKRVIELNDSAAGILKRRVDQMFDKNRPIFANRTGDVYKERSIIHLFREILTGARRAPVPESLAMTLYDFRHFFCSEHAAPGPQHMEMEALAAYIGHSPASTQTLLRWYTDQNALRRGAPVPLVGEPKEGKVITLGRMKGQAE
jgi:integrase